MANTKLGIVARRNALIHLRTFHQFVLQEEWLPWPEKPLVYSSDLPKDISFYPRYISENVLKQLNTNEHHLPFYMQIVIILLKETGRRISEICSLPHDCLEADYENDWFLKVREKKLKKVRLIPISEACLKAIKEQQKYQ